MLKKIKMNKKGIGIIIGTVIFIVLVIAFYGSLIFFVVRSGSGSLIYEQVYSKQIALMIDKAKPGTEIIFDVPERYDSIAKKNKLTEKIIEIDNKNKKVRVRLVNGKGYESSFFNNAKITWDLKEEDERKRLYLNFIEPVVIVDSGQEVENE